MNNIMKQNNINLHFLNASGRLNGFREIIEEEIIKSLTCINEFLEIKNIDIIIKSEPSHTIPFYGLGALCTSNDLISFYLNPNENDFLNLVKSNTKETLAHACHCSIRHTFPGYGTTLFEYLISEGLASHFSMEVTGRRPIWTNSLPLEDIKKYLDIAHPNFDISINPKEHYKWFFGSTEDIPMWTGFNIGFYIVGEYLTLNPVKTASQIVEIKPEDVRTFMESGK